MAAQPVCLDRGTLLNLMQVAAVEGNEQLSSLLSQLTPDLTIVEGEGSVGGSSSTSYEVFDSMQSAEFDKESFLVQLRNFPSIWDKKQPDYKQRNVKSNAWRQLAQIFNKDGEY